MSNWFSTSSSEIPDELWRAPTPMQRQADAVVLWAELTGKHDKVASRDDRGLVEKAYVKAYPLGTKGSRQAIADKHHSLKKKAEMIKEGRNQAFVDALHAIRRNPEISGAALGAPVGAATNYMAYRPTKSGVSRAEASVMGELERARRLNASKKTIDRLKKKLALEEKRRKSLGKTTAVGGALGAGIGASLAHGSAKARGIR